MVGWVTRWKANPASLRETEHRQPEHIECHSVIRIHADTGIHREPINESHDHFCQQRWRNSRLKLQRGIQVLHSFRRRCATPPKSVHDRGAEKFAGLLTEL